MAGASSLQQEEEPELFTLQILGDAGRPHRAS